MLVQSVNVSAAKYIDWDPELGGTVCGDEGGLQKKLVYAPKK